VWVFHHVRGNINGALEIAENVAGVAMASGGRTAQLVAHMMLGQSFDYSGQFEKARRHLDRSWDLYRADVDRVLINLYSTDLLLAVDVHEAHLLWLLGLPDQASAACRRNCELARSLGHPYSLSWTLTWGSTPYLLTGQVAELLANLDKGIAIAEEFGFAYTAAIGTMMRGWGRAEQGDLDAGIAEMRAGLETFTATGAAIVVPFFKSLLAQLYGRAGRKSEGLVLIDEATAQIEKWGERWPEPEVYRAQGLLLAAGPNADPVGAEGSFRRAMSIGAQQRAPGWGLRSTLALARLLRTQDRDAEARALVDGALSVFTEGFETPDVRDARAFELTRPL
jgi:predicted ATPase